MQRSKGARVGAVLASLVFVASPGYAATFTSEATVSYAIGGRTFITGPSEIRYGESNSLTTVNPLTSPAVLSGSIGGTQGGGDNSASIFVAANLEGSAGLMRAQINGNASATWIYGAALAEARITVAKATVGWKDAYLVTGDPADPHPGRPLLIQAFLNVSGGMNSDVSGPNAIFSGYLQLTANDDLNRNLITLTPPYGGSWAYEYKKTDPNFNYLPRPAPGTIPLLLMANEGQAREMNFQMVISAEAAALTTYFGLVEARTSALTFDADYSHTLNWGGITSVVDAATGDPVSGWSIRSASGLDYSQAVVPEPACGVFMLLGAGALLTRRSRS